MKIELQPQYVAKRGHEFYAVGRAYTRWKLSTWMLCLDGKPIAQLATKADARELAKRARVLIATPPGVIGIPKAEALRIALSSEAARIWDRRFRRQEEREAKHHARLRSSRQR